MNMTFKKHNWVDYSSQGDIAEITIKDWSGRKIDFFRCNIKEDSNTILTILKKYGLNMNKENNLKKEIEEERNFLEKEREKNNPIW